METDKHLRQVVFGKCFWMSCFGQSGPALSGAEQETTRGGVRPTAVYVRDSNRVKPVKDSHHHIPQRCAMGLVFPSIETQLDCIEDHMRS